jgi:hypothetical protein
MVRIDMFFFFNIITAIPHIASKVLMVKEFVISLPDYLTPAFLAIFKRQFKRKTFVGVTSHNPTPKKP